MRKIPSIFQRDWNGNRSLVTDEVNPAALWVFQGEGVATRKFDGTAVMIRNAKLFCRFDAKNGKRPPEGFEPAEEAPDAETGHWAGWVPASSPQHKWQMAVFITHHLEDGTYEACGPHFQGNPEHLNADTFVPHGNEKLEAPRTWSELKEWFRDRDIEGVVWHHPDGRMAKIKKKDFGLARAGVADAIARTT
jgi:Family of unknown function (DUF5565)